MNLKELKRTAKRDLDAMLSEPAIQVRRKRNMREWWIWAVAVTPEVEQHLSPENHDLFKALVAMEQFIHSYNVYLTAKKHSRGGAMALILTRELVREET